MGDTDKAAMLELELCDWHLSQQLFGQFIVTYRSAK